MDYLNTQLVKKVALILLLLVGLVACAVAGALPTASPGIATVIPTSTLTPAPIITLTVTAFPMLAPINLVHVGGSTRPTPTPFEGPWDPVCSLSGSGVCIWWFVGLGNGMNPEQQDVEQAVVSDIFKDLYDNPKSTNYGLQLIMLPVPYFFAKDTIYTTIAADNAADIIGPIGWHGAALLQGQMLDLQPQIAAAPETVKDFSPALLESYKTSAGQISVPFALYPSAIFYNTALFDKAGLAYPPVRYGADLSPATYRLEGRDVPWDWDTVREVGRRLTVDANGRNATETGFDKGKIVQYGFTWGYETQPSYLGTFWGNGSYSAADGKTAQLPAAWKDSWAWTYDGIWGSQPFIPNGAVSASDEYAQGNPFNSGKVAMTDQPSWYTCCVDRLQTWDIGALPAYKGKVAGRVDADFFVIWKGTKNPDEAFEALNYLTSTGVQKLILGSPEMPPAYNAIPARIADQAAWLSAKKAQFPWVRNWDLLITNLSFPDSPHAEVYMPNYIKAWDRSQQFYDLLTGTDGLDLAQEEAAFLKDLQTIFDGK